MAIEAGLARGLAQDFQYDQRIQDLRYQKQEMDRAQALNAAKVKMFVDDTDYMNAVNQFDNPRIKQYSEDVIKGLGKYINENPDYMYDAQKMMEVKRLKRQLKDNPFLHQGIASDTAIKQYNADLAEVAKNPERHSKKAYDAVAQQLQNYLKYGNQDGEDAARQLGPKAFTYTKPRDYRDLNDDWKVIGNGWKDVKQTSMAGKGRNAFSEYANPETLKITANQYYSQNKEQVDEESANVGMDPIAYVMKGIDAHIPKRVDFGDYGLIDAMTLRAMDRKAKGDTAAATGPTTWDVEIRGKEEGKESGEVLDKAIGVPKDVKIRDNDGKEIDLTGIDFQHTGRHKAFDVTVIGNDGKPKKVKQKFVEVFADIPKDVSDKYGFTYDPWGWGDYKINSNFEKNESIRLVDRVDKDGNSFKATQIKTWRPIDVNNQAARGRYDKINMATRFQEGVDEGNVNEVEQNGYIYDKRTGQALRKAQ